mmetsp:Transcript_66592/g.205922  ORF Transcript_66592/g.205922 Transcript_66592/m.205922 type:complete len:254 (-) Transcript_66592:1337-2098(-)
MRGPTPHSPHFAPSRTRRASSTLFLSCWSDSKRMSSSLLSISSIMPVIFPASSGWCLAMAGNSFSPIICFCTEGGAAASAEALSGAPGPMGCCCCCCCCGACGIWPGMPGPIGRWPGPIAICCMGGRIMPMGPAMGPMPIMGPPLPPGIMPGPLPMTPIIWGPPIMGPRGPIMVAPLPYMAAACGGIMPIICGGIMPIIWGPPLPIMPMAMGMGPWKPWPPPYICGIMPFPSLPPPFPPLGPPVPGMPPAPGE